MQQTISTQFSHILDAALSCYTGDTLQIPDMYYPII